MSVVRNGSIAVACLALSLVSGCAPQKSMSSADVQKTIVGGLTEQLGSTFVVACPAGMPVEQGYTFTCTATNPATGKQTSITVTETTGSGGFTWKADAPIS
jgi:hypothetical protein